MTGNRIMNNTRKYSFQHVHILMKVQILKLLKYLSYKLRKHLNRSRNIDFLFTIKNLRPLKMTESVLFAKKNWLILRHFMCRKMRIAGSQQNPQSKQNLRILIQNFNIPDFSFYKYQSAILLQKVDEFCILQIKN